MHIFSLEDKEPLFKFVEEEVRNLGVKQPAKLRKHSILKKSHALIRTRIFQRPLYQLPCQPVNLHSGATVEVPCFVVDLCTVLEQRLETEGLFRKAGSAVRQREIKAHIEAGGPVSNEFHEIDLANILKLFFRELPEPLLPHSCQETLIRCQKQSADHLMLSLLLLPMSHLNTLAFLMEFLQHVAAASRLNLMPASNLAIVLAPALMPVPDPGASSKQNSQNAILHEQHIQILQALIEGATNIGEIPSVVALHLGLEIPGGERDEIDGQSLASFASLESLGPDRRGRKRRSGSLTRVLNGVRKMLGAGRGASPIVSENANPGPYTPEGMSPCIMANSCKKRRLDTPGGLSTKKKLEVVLSLPENCVLASTPARQGSKPPCLIDTPLSNALYGSPVISSHPNPQKSPHPQALKQRNRFFTPSKSRSEGLLRRAVLGPTDQKKPRLSFGSKKSSKKAKSSTSNDYNHQEALQPTLPKQKLSWSSLGGSWGRSMRKLAPVNISTPLLQSPYAQRPCLPSFEDDFTGPVAGIDLSPTTQAIADCQIEYEEISNKVSNLQNQLNEEISKAQREREVGPPMATSVQSEYQRTLEDSEQFNNCQTTEQLAKRLSRELKLRRRSGEVKVIRSPSARKIGSLRRRSRDRPIMRSISSASMGKLVRSPIRNTVPTPNSSSLISMGKLVRSPIRSTVPVPNPRSLKRGRPNTVFSGLPQSSPALRCASASLQSLDSSTVVESKVQPSPELRSAQFLVPLSPFFGPVTRSTVQRSASFNTKVNIAETVGEIKKASSFGNVATSTATSTSENDHWKSAENFLKTLTPMNKASNAGIVGRPSIAEIKMNRAGHVLAQVKMFSMPSGTSPKNMEGKLVKPNTASKTRVKGVRVSFEPQENTSSPRRISPRIESAKKTHSVGKPGSIGKPVSRSVSCTPHSVKLKHKRQSRSSKSNNSLPGDWVLGKENFPSPASPFHLSTLALKKQMSPKLPLPEELKDAIYAVCTPRSLKSPLAVKNCNRMDSPISKVTAQHAAQQCPVIKKPLNVRPIIGSALRHTPGLRLETPSKGMKPMIATPLRRSPRLNGMGSPEIWSTPFFK